VYQALGEAIDQLSAQANFLFSDFERLQEVIAIAGAGLYWWWFRIPRLPPTHLDQDLNDTGNHPSSRPSVTASHPADTTKYTLPETPFIIGTPRSADAVLEVKVLVGEIVDRDLPTIPVAFGDGILEESYMLAHAFDTIAVTGDFLELLKLDKGADSD
jgi:hypothetical protein